MSLSDYAENAILDHMTGVSSWTSPTGLYMALFTNPPTEGGSGTEMTGSGYARQPVSFTTAADGLAVSTADVTFTVPSGTIRGGALFDAATGGNMIAIVSTTDRPTSGGETITVAAGTISLTLD